MSADALKRYEQAVERLQRERTREASEAAENAHYAACLEMARASWWRDPLGFRAGRFVSVTGAHERTGNELWRLYPEHMNGGAELFKIYPSNPEAKREGSEG